MLFRVFEMKNRIGIKNKNFSFEKFLGDPDGTRTRDLRRDRAAF